MKTPTPEELRELANEMTTAMGTRLNFAAIEKLRACADALEALRTRSTEVASKSYHPQFAMAWKEAANILQPNARNQRREAAQRMSVRWNE